MAHASTLNVYPRNVPAMCATAYSHFRVSPLLCGHRDMTVRSNVRQLTSRWSGPSCLPRWCYPRPEVPLSPLATMRRLPII